MQMSSVLQEAIEREIECLPMQQITKAREELTERYQERHNRKSIFMTTEAHRLAYIAARMPATYAAISHVLQEIKHRVDPASIRTLLDLGAGPGTAMWASCEIFPEIERFVLLERDAQLIALGKRLAIHSDHAAVRAAEWQPSDLQSAQTLPSSDLIMLSYSIGELAEGTVSALLQRCWEATRQFLVIIEPGTPEGFGRIRLIRSQLIALGSHIVAPCPHAEECPMQKGDWCHFSERAERSSIHRKVKGGLLGHEDEKFSYIVVSKTPVILPFARVLRHPAHRSGHINFVLCTAQGVQQQTISKKSSALYKQAKKLEWGSSFDNVPV